MAYAAHQKVRHKDRTVIEVYERVEGFELHTMKPRINDGLFVAAQAGLLAAATLIGGRFAV